MLLAREWGSNCLHVKEHYTRERNAEGAAQAYKKLDENCKKQIDERMKPDVDACILWHVRHFMFVQQIRF